jgi:hypothetical protein
MESTGGIIKSILNSVLHRKEGLVSLRNCKVPVAREKDIPQEFSMLLSLLRRWAGVEPNPITSNGGQRIDHAVKA